MDGGSLDIRWRKARFAMSFYVTGSGFTGIVAGCHHQGKSSLTPPQHVGSRARGGTYRDSALKTQFLFRALKCTMPAGGDTVDKESVFANYKSVFSRQFAVSLAVEFLGGHVLSDPGRRPLDLALPTVSALFTGEGRQRQDSAQAATATSSTNIMR